jgi:hypothetical protein
LLFEIWGLWDKLGCEWEQIINLAHLRRVFARSNRFHILVLHPVRVASRVPVVFSSLLAKFSSPTIQNNQKISCWGFIVSRIKCIHVFKPASSFVTFIKPMRR